MKKSEMNILHATKEDLEHAAKDALYAQRLEERGLSPFKLFIELNEIARKIRASSETPQTSQTRQRRHRRTRRKKPPRKTKRQTRPQIPNKEKPNKQGSLIILQTINKRTF